MSESKLEMALTEYMCAEGEALMIENEDIECEFSDEFLQKMDKLINRRRKPYFRMINSVSKRVACIALAVFIATATTVMSVDALRNAVFNFFLNVFSDHSDIRAADDDQHPDTIEEIYDITYDLSEYYVDFKSDYDHGHILKYKNKDTKSIIRLEQYTNSSLNLAINTEDAEITHIDMNGYDTIYYCDNHNYHVLIWDNGRYTLMISSNLTKEETLKIAKSVKKVETK